MKNYKTILFDLDGTLTDSAIGIANSVQYALKKYNISVEDRKQLYCFVGPPLIDSFVKFFNFSEEKAREAVGYYREYYTEKGMLENTVYDGIEPMLQQLKESGATLLVATSKPEVFARQILSHFGLEKYFTFIGGSTLDETRVKKAEVIAYTLDACGITDFSEILMVGDREHDVIGAKTVGIDCIGVLFGYGSREELEQAGATYIAETVEDLQHQLLLHI